MRFKNRETGEILYSIIEAGAFFCKKGRENMNACEECSLMNELNKKSLKITCFEYASINQKEAADIMGYDVIGDE